MIHAHQIAKSFGTVKAVRSVNFSAENGKITGLLGPNGAGKTTTLRMLSGLIRPDSGHVLVDEVNTRTDAKAVRSKIGVLPDAQGIYPRLTARENIQYFGELYLMRPDDIKARIEFLVEELDMHDFIDRRTAGFSQGQRMKVAIARAIVHNPINVLLDEPTNGLDVMSTRAMRDVIRNMKANGQCVIFSSHLMQEVVALCDEVFIIADGMIVESGSIDSLLNKYDSGFEDVFVQIIDQQTSEAP
ncbi:MAG: ATP-binding cassette domain-containing protein [Myxococcota bacterium]|nr:ATP-binding cassette domain-containing protein [Myxococcota bacterium]